MCNHDLNARRHGLARQSCLRDRDREGYDVEWSEISVRSDIVVFVCVFLHANLCACKCVCILEMCMSYD